MHLKVISIVIAEAKEERLLLELLIAFFAVAVYMHVGLYSMLHWLVTIYIYILAVGN